MLLIQKAGSEKQDLRETCLCGFPELHNAAFLLQGTRLRLDSGEILQVAVVFDCLSGKLARWAALPSARTAQFPGSACHMQKAST